MGQKVNPISNRLGIIKGWDSNWYGGNDYAEKIVEDFKIRKYLMAHSFLNGRALGPLSPPKITQ